MVLPDVLAHVGTLSLLSVYILMRPGLTMSVMEAVVPLFMERQSCSFRHVITYGPL